VIVCKQKCELTADSMASLTNLGTEVELNGDLAASKTMAVIEAVGRKEEGLTPRVSSAQYFGNSGLCEPAR
jgi:hypothetical protein